MRTFIALLVLVTAGCMHRAPTSPTYNYTPTPPTVEVASTLFSDIENDPAVEYFTFTFTPAAGSEGAEFTVKARPGYVVRVQQINKAGSIYFISCETAFEDQQERHNYSRSAGVSWQFGGGEEWTFVCKYEWMNGAAAWMVVPRNEKW